MDETVPYGKRRKRAVLYSCLFVILAIAAGASYYLYHFVFTGQEIPPQPYENVRRYNYGLTDETADASEIKGTIALSLVRKDAPPSFQPSLYLLDVSNPQNVLVADTVRSKTRANHSIVYPDKKVREIYFAVTSSATSSNSNDVYRVHRTDYIKMINEPIQTIEGTLERHISYNPNKELLAYAALPGVQTDNLNSLLINSKLSDWEIRVIDLNSRKEQVVVNGIRPMWSPDGEQILYVREDGLYRYRFDVDSSEKVWDVADDGNGISVVSKFGLSPNGRFLAWTTPDLNLITMFEIISWEPFVMDEIGRIQSEKSQYYWPVFSPDSRFYVVQAADWKGGEQPENARLEIRETKGREVLRTFSLEEYDFLRAFTNDWIE